MIVAVDFDGVLCEDAFPGIGRPNYGMVSLVRELIDQGHEVILWTCRVEERLAEAVEWCEDMGLHFCAVNDNAPSNLEQYGTNSRKVYADLYLEDRDPWFMEQDYRYNIGLASPAEERLETLARYWAWKIENRRKDE